MVVLESHHPCYGATGAGQGYIWLAHRQPDCPAWELAKRSRELWQGLVQPDAQPFLAPASHIGWQVSSVLCSQVHSPLSNLQNVLCGQENGSILLGIGEGEDRQLAARHAMLGSVGISSCMLDERELREAEPALDGSKPMAGLLVSNDAQLVK